MFFVYSQEYESEWRRLRMMSGSNLDDIYAVFDDTQEQEDSQHAKNDLDPLVLNAFDLIILSQGSNHETLVDKSRVWIHSHAVIGDTSNKIYFSETSKSGLIKYGSSCTVNEFLDKYSKL
ncbi:CBL-interacting serine/threonine-protein kinase 24-like isoform X2 [Silene latifolia]|uniref:CBL-interacting serine/threonine-protein kinase 24-like isoform X2 n=1 Tax=Silene latifolia TaxID=37657 RepID=UPI003D78424E